MALPMRKVEIDPVAWAAREIELSASDLMRQVQTATTVDDAIELWEVARMVEAQIAKVGDEALRKAERLCGK